MMNKFVSWAFLLLIFVSCSNKEISNDVYSLEPTDDFLEYEIDSDTEIPLFNLYTFEDNGVEYLTFSNRFSRTILIYDLNAQELVKKVVFAGEGPNGIGNWLFGYFVKDMNHIYVPSANREEIFITDTTGILRDKIDYSLTEDGESTVKAYYTNLDNVQMTFIGDSLFIPQMLNNRLGDRMVEESKTFVVVNMHTRKVFHFPMNFPQLISTSDVRTTIEGALTYSQVYDGENFIYSFAMDENLYKVNPQSGCLSKIPAISRYISDLKFKKIPNDFTQNLKKTCETADYGNILYDKYRKVYYRFVYPETELEQGLNYLNILHTGKKEFSIIIMDENLKIIGETKFPAYTYLSYICFINKNGLYLSTSHFMREDYNDDVLRFQRFELVEK